MKLETHILKAIEANARGSKDEELMHATIGINATARKLQIQSNERTMLRRAA